mmetsp:Transcript_21636/g.38759  ORF Transcript_21636/g.38759 Transcript_21636/m.38759 type:complete len:219 (-) Transcript_21636:280-936(-)
MVSSLYGKKFGIFGKLIFKGLLLLFARVFQNAIIGSVYYQRRKRLVGFTKAPEITARFVARDSAQNHLGNTWMNDCFFLFVFDCQIQCRHCPCRVSGQYPFVDFDIMVIRQVFQRIHGNFAVGYGIGNEAHGFERKHHYQNSLIAQRCRNPRVRRVAYQGTWKKDYSDFLLLNRNKNIVFVLFSNGPFRFQSLQQERLSGFKRCLTVLAEHEDGRGST